MVKRPEDLKWQEHPLRILDIPCCPDFLPLLLQIVEATGHTNIRFFLETNLTRETVPLLTSYMGKKTVSVLAH